jgi:hypothetical protein
MEALKKINIQVVLRENKDGIIYGITFIDFRTKAVINGSDIGKQYSITGIREQLNQNNPPPSIEKTFAPPNENSEKNKAVETQPVSSVNEKTNTDILKELIDHEKNFTITPHQLKRKSKKKQNKNT